MAFNYSPKIVTDGLVLYLDAANNLSYPGSGVIWKDISRGSNNGILTNGPTFDTGSGGAIVFDGTDDFVDFDNQPLFNLPNITVEIIFSLSQVPSSTNYVVRNRVFGYGIAFGISGSTNYNVSATDDTTTSYNYPSGSVQLNVPRSACFTFGNSTFNVYENGNLKYSTATSSSTLYYGATPQTNIFRLSRDGGSGTGKFLNGKIYSAKVYTRALSSTEVLQNFNAVKTRFGL